MGAILALIGLYLVVTLALPLGIMLAKSVQDSKGAFVGLANFARYFTDAGARPNHHQQPLRPTVSTVICVPSPSSTPTR